MSPAPIGVNSLDRLATTTPIDCAWTSTMASTGSTAHAAMAMPAATLTVRSRGEGRWFHANTSAAGTQASHAGFSDIARAAATTAAIAKIQRGVCRPRHADQAAVMANSGDSESPVQ